MQTMTNQQDELNPFERWMVQSNLAHIQADATETVTLLHARGYHRVADAVERAANERAAKQARRENEDRFGPIGS